MYVYVNKKDGKITYSKETKSKNTSGRLCFTSSKKFVTNKYLFMTIHRTIMKFENKYIIVNMYISIKRIPKANLTLSTLQK